MAAHPLIAELARARKALGLSTRDAAELAGVGQSTIVKMERGTRGVSLDVALLVAAAYGLSFDLQPTASRPCTVCLELKPVAEFEPCRRRRDGLTAYCRACKPEAVSAQRDALLAIFEDGNAQRSRARAARVAAYSKHRDAGLDPKETAVRMCLTKPTRERYERAYRNRAQEAAA